MTGVTNSILEKVVGGGVGFIKVFFKSGTTVTCTKGSTVLTSDTSGNYIFEIPEAGEWTLQSNGKSKTVNVVYGNVYSVAFATMLTYSDESKILSEAFRNFFDISTANVGGEFYAHNLGNVSLDNELDLRTLSDTHIYYDRGENVNDEITIYMVGKSVLTNKSARLLTVLKGNTADSAPGFFQNTNNHIYSTKFGSDEDSNLSANSTFAIALVIKTGGVVDFFANGTYTRLNVANAVTNGRYIYFSGTGAADNPDDTTGYGDELKISHIAIVDGAESSTVINNNLTKLLTDFS